jgi:hypothetical protein
MIKKRGMTDFLKNFLFILGIFFAVFFVVIIVYNISTIKPKEVSSVDLKIDKSSVKINENILSITIIGEENKKYVEQVKFILYDGEESKETIMNTSQLKKIGIQNYTILFRNLGFLSIKSISITPGIKTKAGIKFLSVSDRVLITETGEVQASGFVCGNGILEGTEQCDDGNKLNDDGCSSECKLEGVEELINACGDCGILCSREKCHNILLTNNKKCYYEGKFSRKCTSCSLMSCTQYTTQDDCSDNRCKLSKCTWSNGKCRENPDCGDGYINSTLGETCEPPATACSASYGQNCTYCGSGCTNTIVTGGSCGDSLCNGVETYATCPNDCETTCGDGSCVGTETCSSCSADCGSCCGDGICNSTIGETCSSCVADCKKCNGESCTLGTQCSSGNCIDGYCCDTSCSSTCKSCNVAGYLGTCYNDPLGTVCSGGECDGSGNCASTLKENGESCNVGGDCSSGYCSDNTCCNTGCVGVCNTCTTGTCVNLADGATPTGCNTGNKKCNGFGGCVDWLWIEYPTYGYAHCAAYGQGDCADCYDTWRTCNPTTEGLAGWAPWPNGNLPYDFGGYKGWTGGTWAGSNQICSHFMATGYPFGYNQSTYFGCEKRIIG